MSGIDTGAPFQKERIKERILDAAEKLYAEQGLNAVSLRQIGVEAGARNTNAVQYHFTNTEGLIRGVLDRHAPELEVKRAQLLAEYAGKGKLTPRELLEVLYRPMLENTGSAQVPLFARFSLALQTSPGGWGALVDVFQTMSVTQQVFELITEANKPVPAAITWQRILYAGFAVITYSINISHVTRLPDCYSAAVTDGFVMAAAALSAPVDKSSKILVSELEQFFNPKHAGPLN